MKDAVIMLLIISGWFALMRWVLPRFGVPT
jgi:hypothetical protein